MASGEFKGHFSRRVGAAFDGGTMTSDGGALLLRETDRRLNLLPRLAECFLDRRPLAPTKFRSIQAVNSPAAAPSANHGSEGSTSRFQPSRPRRHQKTTSKAAGSVAVTVLLSSARTNSARARKYCDLRRV